MSQRESLPDQLERVSACPRCGHPGYDDVLNRRWCGNPYCERTDELETWVTPDEFRDRTEDR